MGYSQPYAGVNRIKTVLHLQDILKGSRFEEPSKTASCQATYSDVFPSNLQQRTGGKHLALRRAPAFAPQLAFPEMRNRQRRHRVATRESFRLKASKFGLHHFTEFTASAGSA